MSLEDSKGIRHGKYKTEILFSWAKLVLTDRILFYKHTIFISKQADFKIEIMGILVSISNTLFLISP
jgi:hypothetical protein